MKRRKRSGKAHVVGLHLHVRSEPVLLLVKVSLHTENLPKLHRATSVTPETAGDQSTRIPIVNISNHQLLRDTIPPQDPLPFQPTQNHSLTNHLGVETIWKVTLKQADIVLQLAGWQFHPSYAMETSPALYFILSHNRWCQWLFVFLLVFSELPVIPGVLLLF